MNREDKDGLAELFAQMNTAVPEAEKKDREFLEKYTSANCALLCAASTRSRGFITASLGEEVSLERAKVVEAAYSLVGKVPYFWGGKSSAIGWDSRWEKPARITAAGISATGTVENFRLSFCP